MVLGDRFPRKENTLLFCVTASRIFVFLFAHLVKCVKPYSYKLLLSCIAFKNKSKLQSSFVRLKVPERAQTLPVYGPCDIYCLSFKFHRLAQLIGRYLTPL